MRPFFLQTLESIKSSAGYDNEVDLFCELQVVDSMEKSSQPQLKYMMSSHSSPDERIQNTFEQEFHANPSEQKLNDSNQNQMQIQNYNDKNERVQTLNQSEPKRPKRNRRKLNVNSQLMDFQSENNSSSQNLSIIACRCTKSNCLKLYCLCFHQNQKCSDLCKCFECKNKAEHFEIRFNALEKVKQKLHRQKNDDDLFDRSKIWGCKCQKSQCQKNYCECFVRNQKCSSSCRCKDCANKKRFPFQQKKKQKNQSQV
ncbi:unnamed protein product (macronuclear) [Paramecium tetraurelia]|uniref:CRC domain-containing protein n=1 Tax=Paramecium tetraurelia TaxID=5888 RepID=A0BVQ8_PARTE|nr:uncharacterized protein GSPATT00032477001 [Paramecium tetraurelia]CAK62625.1 unnamed protein product [Paramecium tetraurelia]|eukprot:XP_001430023.1 hypothetical protein (macronuclear) [Paramecium tetraurelia strain d4-2]